jgi:hypothetical protein
MASFIPAESSPFYLLYDFLLPTCENVSITFQNCACPIVEVYTK